MKTRITDSPEVHIQFFEVAKELFCNWVFMVNSTSFKIIEVEFYYYSTKHNHLDGFTHPHLRNGGELRLHFGGIDITFDSTEESYGGILIRSMMNTKTGEITNGPRRLLTKVFQEIGNIKSGAFLKLERVANPAMAADILETKRVGLKQPNRKTPNDDAYRNANYRFITELVRENKVADKEDAALSIMDSEKQKEFLGYKLKRS